MRYFIITVFVIALVGCNKRQTSINMTKEYLNNDSLLLTQRQDSIERERIFEALGDTVFGCVCYGMNKSQFHKAYNEFKEPLKSGKEYYDFEFAGYEFVGDEGSNIENNNEKSVNGFPYGLENILKEDMLRTYYYKNKLFSVRWDSNKEIQSINVVKYSLGKIISLFEKKYGKPNVNNIDRIEMGARPQIKVIAKWETGKRKIIMIYRDLVGSERDKWMDENYSSDYQYELVVQFLDKTQKREVDEYIKHILRKFADDSGEKIRQDSIKNANAL